jgi:hypothetical protein
MTLVDSVVGRDRQWRGRISSQTRLATSTSKRGRGASKYFIVGTLMIDDPHQLGVDLLNLRRELAWQGVGLESSFHATEDAQIVRDEVFPLTVEVVTSEPAAISTSMTFRRSR